MRTFRFSEGLGCEHICFIMFNLDEVSEALSSVHSTVLLGTVNLPGFWEELYTLMVCIRHVETGYLHVCA